MRIDRLDLLRFGHFTDVSLDLSRPGVHVVVGRNEAGKTTAMAAIQQLLFGFPVRSPYAFIHDLRDLSIGAVLRDETNEELEIVRVKRQTGTLRDPHGEVIPDTRLAKYLHDIDHNLFTHLFSVSHDEIVRGGEALLNADGEVGRALFSASRGAASLDAALRALDARAAEIYKSSASNPQLNAAIRQFKEKSELARKLSSSPAEAVTLDRALQAATDAYEATTAARRAKADRRAVLERVRSARPLLASFTAQLDEKLTLERAGKIIDLSVEQQLEDAKNRRATARSQQTTESATVDRLEEQLAALQLDSELTAQADEVEALVAESGGYRQNIADLPALHVRIGEKEREQQKLLESLPPAARQAAEAGKTVTAAQSARVSELIEERHTIQGAVDAVRIRRDDAQQSLEQARERLANAPVPQDTHALTALVEKLKAGGDLESTHEADVQRVNVADANLANELTSLGLDPGQRDNIDSLRVPTIDQIRALGAEFDRLTGLAARYTTDIDEQTNAIETDSEALARLLDEQHPRTQDELAQARTRRDTGWEHVLADWIDHTPDVSSVTEWAQGAPLSVAYADAVAHADQVADDLRADADAVASRAALETSLTEHRVKLNSLTELRGQTRAEIETLQTGWESSWAESTVSPDTPRQMEMWHERFREAAKNAVTLRALKSEVKKSAVAIARSRTDILAALLMLGVTPPQDFSLTALRDYATSIAEAERNVAQSRSTLVETITDLELKESRLQSEVTSAELTVEAWSSSWDKILAQIGLPAQSSPAEATAVLKSLDELSEAKLRGAEYSLRAKGIEKRNKEISTRVTRLIRALPQHQDLLQSDPGVASITLGRRLQEGQAVATEYRATAEEKTKHVRSLRDAEDALAATDLEITTLLASVDLPDEPSLAEAIIRSRQHRTLLERIHESEQSLRQSSGLPVDKITTEVDELATIEIEPEIQEIDASIENLDATLKEQGPRLGELREKRSLLTADGEAADMANEAELALTLVAELGDQYVEILLAKHLLEAEIEEYRKTHQGPILARASELFKSLTLKRYAGLESDTDEKSRPILLARTTANKLLDVNSLSTGTRDQMYLSLRLSALEQVIERRGTIPIVLDDLFVHFDDERTQAGLTVLGDVSRQAQVLLFTHHQQVAAQAQAAIAEGMLTIHQLN